MSRRLSVPLARHRLSRLHKGPATPAAIIVRLKVAGVKLADPTNLTAMKGGGAIRRVLRPEEWQICSLATPSRVERAADFAAPGRNLTKSAGRRQVNRPIEAQCAWWRSRIGAASATAVFVAQRCRVVRIVALSLWWSGGLWPLGLDGLGDLRGAQIESPRQ